MRCAIVCIGIGMESESHHATIDIIVATSSRDSVEPRSGVFPVMHDCVARGVPAMTTARGAVSRSQQFTGNSKRT